jgi:hypothetical protein
MEMDIVYMYSSKTWVPTYKTKWCCSSSDYNINQVLAYANYVNSFGKNVNMKNNTCTLSQVSYENNLKDMKPKLATTPKNHLRTFRNMSANSTNK